MNAHSINVEIDRNFDFFQRNLGAYLSSHEGEFAVIRHQAIAGFCGSVADAEALGEKDFPDGLYSIQEVTSAPVDLGFFTHAIHNGPSA